MEKLEQALEQIHADADKIVRRAAAASREDAQGEEG